MSKSQGTVEDLRRAQEELRARLEVAEDTIRAISGGEVDAFVVAHGPELEVLTLGAAERPYRLLVEAMGQGAATLGADGTILYANARFAELLDLPLEKVVGADLAGFVPEADRPLFESVLHRARAGGASVEVTLRRSDGAALPVNVAANFLPAGIGGVCLIVTDLTEQKRREEERVHLVRVQTARAELEQRVEERAAELRAVQQKALQAERLAAVGQMAAGLAHESRNALQRSQACLSVLALKLQDRPEELALLTRMQQAQDDLHRLYEEVRAYAAPLRLDTSVCRLADLWREAWADLGAQGAALGARLHESAGTEAWACNVDRFQLKQVFRNLLENALAAGGQPPRVEIACAPVPLDEGDGVQISVRDNGAGFSAESRRRLFEPFFTTKLHGTGLGLPICKRVIEAHQGRIEVGTAPGPGAEILITLPRSSS